MAKGKGKRKIGAGDVASNRYASHRYELIERLECGIVLEGTEVKALRTSGAQLKDGYAAIREGELWLHSVHIRSRLARKPRTGTRPQAAAAPARARPHRRARQGARRCGRARAGAAAACGRVPVRGFRARRDRMWTECSQSSPSRMAA